VGDEEERRARVEAEAASSGARSGPPEDDHASARPPLPAGPQAGSAEPDGVLPPVPRYLEPIRPWLTANSVDVDGDDAAGGRSPGPEEPADRAAAGPGTGPGSRLFEPVRPWQLRRTSEQSADAGPPAPVEQPETTADPPQPALELPPSSAGPDGALSSSHVLQPVRPWLYQRPSEPRPRVAPPVADRRPYAPPPLPAPAVHRPQAEVPEADASAAAASQAAASEADAPPAEAAQAENDETPPTVVPRRRWHRQRADEDEEDGVSIAEWLAPARAEAADVPDERGPGAEPAPPVPPLPRVPLGATGASAPPDEVPAQAGDDARGGPLRRALDWLLEPADPTPARADLEEEVEASARPVEPPIAAPPVEPPRPVEAPPVEPPPVEAPPVEAPPVEPPPVEAPPIEAPPVEAPPIEAPRPVEPAPVTPGTDLARRLAAANAAAMARARRVPPAVPVADDEHADEDDDEVEVTVEDAPKYSPLVTGTAFAPRVTRTSESATDRDRDDTDAGRPGKRPTRWGRRLVAVLVVCAVGATAALLLRTFVVAPYIIPSASMEPTLHGCTGCNDDRVLVNKLSYRFHGIHRGDVVVFHRPKTWQVSDKVLIKRVIGLPGDVLTTRRGTVYVDGLQLAEPYVNPRCKGGTIGLPSKSVTVRPDTAFVMGDNRCDSSDSRRFGAIPQSSVIGRAFVTIWPFGRIHWL
jgi:signal peptidase I